MVIPVPVWGGNYLLVYTPSEFTEEFGRMYVPL